MCAALLRLSCQRAKGRFRRRTPCSVKEWMAEVQVVGQREWRIRVPLVVSYPLLQTPPYGDGIDPEATYDLRSRRAGLLLGPIQALTEIVRHSVYRSAAMSELSRYLGVAPAGHTGPHAPCEAEGADSPPIFNCYGQPASD